MPQAMRTFGFGPGRKVGPRYVVESLLGTGTEGEVYRIQEIKTGIVRAAKFYFPHKDPNHTASVRHAQKLEKLRNCEIVLQYHHSEVITVRRQQVLAMISDLCEGQPLDAWIASHRGERLTTFKALHVLYHLARGVEQIHALGQYHSDIHSQNILIQPIGVRFEIKLIDFFDWGKPTRSKQEQDILDTIRVFHECLGGRKYYPRTPPEVRYVCGALRESLILKRFPTISHLRRHLENFEWTNSR